MTNYINNITQARQFSVWLARQLDSGKLDLATLENWVAKPIQTADFAAFADWDTFFADENEAELGKQLRVLRRYVMATLIVRDTTRLADLNEIMRTITEFADFSINMASRYAEQYYRDMYGTPLGQYTGAKQHLSVVAMGKAGGFELNVSSDIDLIFVFQESGETNGKRERSNQEFFTKVGQKIIALLDEITDEGQVFRVDMRLRPDGDSGALVLSETALEQYLITQGREWERYAWCKGRVVTPYPNDIQGIVRPFVFRKYLDFHTYEAMRGLHRQIQQEVQKRGMADNIKLGAGGIREVEFIAQIFQMIRGGQQRALQLKGTQETLHQLAQLGILSRENMENLLAAYVFLRDVEHRLQYWDDQQTQMLPENPEQQSLLAQSMGFTDYAAFSGSLNRHRDTVNRLFNDILQVPQSQDGAPHELANIWLNAEEKTHETQLAQLGFRQPERLMQRLRAMKNSSKYRQLSTIAQPRFDAVLPQCIEAAAACANPDETLLRLLDLLDNISRRSAYLAFLQQHPAALKRVAELMSQSSWLADYLQRRPILLDELLSAQLMQPIQWDKANAELSGSLNACEDDTESKMDVLRRFQHAHVFRLAVQDLADKWTVEALSDELSLLADTVLSHTLQHAWQSVPKKHQHNPQFAIIAYGKLGGKELGYTSDLDLVYLFQDDDANAADLYTKLARRLGTWLSSSTGAGTLYETDLRLRPDGDSGSLIHSLAAFEKYQREQAWTWEHQSLTRARFVCGDEAVGKQFEQIRRQILTTPRDMAQLKSDILEMREKMFATHPPHDNDVKYARGGVVDVEFIVQYWVLAYSQHHPQLLENYGNIALLNIAAQCGLIDTTLAAQNAAAYRHFRHVQHNKKLRNWERVKPDDELLAHYAVVKRLWCGVFGEEAKTV
ncbi:bifunctional [glutamate--ammonia ligase]-adenylyl-L-tyrosine phosphorylase/[glutamate--ammonia-ligase] adenylyltransferase [Neisseriaceae bacterium B1]